MLATSDLLHVDNTQECWLDYTTTEVIYHFTDRSLLIPSSKGPLHSSIVPTSTILSTQPCWP